LPASIDPTRSYHRSAIAGLRVTMSASSRSSASPAAPAFSRGERGRTVALPPRNAVVAQATPATLGSSRSVREPLGDQSVRARVAEHHLGERLVHVRRPAVEEQVRERRPDELRAEPVAAAVRPRRRGRAHLGEVGALERGAVDDHRLVGEEAVRLQRRELGARRDRVAGAPVAVADALAEVENPRIDLPALHRGEEAREVGAAERRDR
jgi:hypothetical protein